MTKKRKSLAYFAISQTVARTVKRLGLDEIKEDDRPEHIQSAMQDVSDDKAFNSWDDEPMSMEAMMDDNSVEEDRAAERAERDAEWALDQSHGC